MNKKLVGAFKAMKSRFRAAPAYAALVVTGAAATAGASAQDVDAIVSDAGALLTSIYPIVIGAVGFGILISLVKMVRRK